MKRHRTIPLGQCQTARRRGRPPRPVVAPIPRPFDFGFTARRPLVPMPAVCMFLNKKPREVLALIEDGHLRWAFDIRRPDAERREVRVLRQSLFEYTGLWAPPQKPRRDEAAEFAEIIERILPAGMVVKPNVAPGKDFRARSQAARQFQIKMRLSAATFRQTLFPHEPILRGTEIAQCFSCLSQHVVNLLKAGAFAAVSLRRGPKASPLITRASVVEFLKQRRMA
ncbi:MAG TPA: hypothetical protein VH413_18805 [Verrucomicrobiae bacterium]|nr:hypothetical protein [Verrucomicrobiae bacterium]